MSRKGQLQTMIRYVQLNPQRLATKRLKPEYFYVQEGVEINGRNYSAVGNSKILMEAQRSPVHVRHTATCSSLALGNTIPCKNMYHALSAWR